MTYSELVSILQETKLSPEELAPKLGVSNMTLRRWKSESGTKALPKGYERTVREGLYQLLAEGYLDHESPRVKAFFEAAEPMFFQAAMRSFGIPKEFASLASNQEDQVTLGLSHIGGKAEKQKAVDDQIKTKRLERFKKFGEEWKRRITGLVRVVRSSELSTLDKLVAYGALFYLITPFDLIPDSIPIFGYVDDYAILGFAMVYYARKFPGVFKKA